MDITSKRDALIQIRRIMDEFDIPSVDDKLRAILSTECCYLGMQDGVYHLVDPTNDKIIITGDTLPELFYEFGLQQFKPQSGKDGPKIGSIELSPREDEATAK